MRTPRQHSAARLHHHPHRQMRAWIAALVVICGLMPVAGCRTGTSALTAPSWFSFGGSGSGDASKLASAPPFEGKITKPSATATPYPTTTTPEGYALGAGDKGAAGAAAAPALAATDPPAVTYGSTPSAPAAQPGYPQTSPGPTVPTTGPSTIAPQVGPYASVPGQSRSLDSPPLTPIPAAQPAAPPAGGSLAAVPSQAAAAFGTQPAVASPPAAPGAFPATAGYEPAARFGGAQPAAPPAAPAGDPLQQLSSVPSGPTSPVASSRYASVPGSRFGAGEPPAAPAGTSPVVPPAAGSEPAVPAPAPFSAPAAPPARRPDPGYRPGGTSSYRPSSAILAGEAGAESGAVRTAGFEEPAALQR